MNNKPQAYVTSAWVNGSRAKGLQKRYCRKLYEAGYTNLSAFIIARGN